MDQKILQVLTKLYTLFKKNNIFWILSGSTSLSIQNVDVKINDIDIVTDKENFYLIDKLLSQFRIQFFDYSKKEMYQSYFAIYKIDQVKVEVMGEFQYLLKDNTWSKPNHKNKIIFKEYKNMLLPLLTLEQEIIEYQSTNKPEKVEKIKQAINSRVSQSG